MKIEEKKVVEVIYDLTVDGEVVDSATKERPLDYIHGMKMLIPKFEKEIEGMEPGDHFSFEIESQDAYGQYDPSRKFDIPMSSFEIDGKIPEGLLEVGRMVPMLNTSGQVVNGQIVAIKEDEQKVTMDFNHPMAGKKLCFAGEVLSVRDATDKELTEGLHGEFLPHDECGCGCHHHHHEDGECCGHGQGHHHEDGECCGHGHGHHHEDGECCEHGHGHHHEDGECCGHGHHHEDGKEETGSEEKE